MKVQLKWSSHWRKLPALHALPTRVIIPGIVSSLHVAGSCLEIDWRHTAFWEWMCNVFVWWALVGLWLSVQWVDPVLLILKEINWTTVYPSTSVSWVRLENFIARCDWEKNRTQCTRECFGSHVCHWVSRFQFVSFAITWTRLWRILARRSS